MTQGTPGPDTEPPLACSLEPAGIPDRLAAWQALLSTVVRRERLDDCLRMTLPASADVGELAHLARAEHECCPFLTFTMTFDERGTGLEVRAPEAALDDVATMFGFAA
jgi:MerR family transcriptional regulator, copper efflux regulator